MRPLTYPIWTPRLKLVPVTASLAAAARAGADAFDEALGARAADDWRAASLALVARSSEAATKPIRAIVVSRLDGAAIGDVRFEPALFDPLEIEIGYGIAGSRRRQGYASEATGAIIDWLFEEGGAARCSAGCDRKNVASVRTLRKLGFWLDTSSGSAFWWTLSPELREAARA
jgi:RimJ/RimL family protein N-acetyltransferase